MDGLSSGWLVSPSVALMLPLIIPPLTPVIVNPPASNWSAGGFHVAA